jgi:hypothetical protein
MSEDNLLEDLRMLPELTVLDVIMGETDLKTEKVIGELTSRATQAVQCVELANVSGGSETTTTI